MLFSSITYSVSELSSMPVVILKQQHKTLLFYYLCPRANKYKNTNWYWKYHNLCVTVQHFRSLKPIPIKLHPEDMSLKIAPVLIYPCHNAYSTWFTHVGFRQLKHMFRKPLLIVENLHQSYQLGMKLRSLEGKVTFSHSTEPFQCQTSPLCPPHHIREGKYTLYLPLSTFRGYHLHFNTLRSAHILQITAYTCV